MEIDLAPKTNSKDEVRDCLRALVLALAAAYKQDGRISLDGAEYDIYPERALVEVGSDEIDWPGEDYAFMQVEPVYHQEFTSLFDGIGRRHSLLHHKRLTVTVDQTTSVWLLYPLGQSVPGQRSIEHQAGSPKPEPEIIHPNDGDDDDPF